MPDFDERIEMLTGQVGALHDMVVSILTALAQRGDETLFREVLANLTACEKLARERNEHASRVEMLADVRAAFDEF
jgi:hypothetical protein